jgi:hypothetical protein
VNPVKNKIKSIMTSILRMFKEQTSASLETPILESQAAVLLEAGPNDMVVLTYPGRLSVDQKQRIVDLWLDWKKDKTRPIVLDNGMKIVVIKRPQP